MMLSLCVNWNAADFHYKSSTILKDENYKMGHIFKTNIRTFNLYFIDYVSPSNTSAAAYKWN